MSSETFFCYSGLKSLHILIAIIKLSGLNVFICIYIFCGRCRTKKCSSNQNARSERFNCLFYLSVNVCICIPLRILFAQTRYVISAFTHAVQTEGEWQTNINNPIFLPGARFNKEVQPTLSLNLNSELTYSEMGNSEFSGSEQLNRVSLLNSK